MAKQKVNTRVLSHTESKPDLSFGLPLLFHGILAKLLAKLIVVYAGFL